MSTPSSASEPGSGEPTRSEVPGDLDEWLASLLGTERDVSLVAVGSFGRGDRAPHSDLDLVLLHRGRRDIKDVAERVWYPVWDRGLALDHSVRTVKEAVGAAERDLKVALGLLDARHVAGDRKLTADLTARTAGLWRKRARAWIPQVRDATRERHEHFGEVAFLLEPEIKEGRGGLRDVAVLRALQRATTILGDLLPAMTDAHTTLVVIRRAMHERAGRLVDRLVLQDQDAIAAALGLADADELLANVSGAARTISFVGDDCWRRVAGWLGGGKPANGDRPLGPAVSLRSGEVHAHDSTHWLAAAATAADLHVPLARTTLQRFADEVPTDNDPWPYGWRQSLVALLGAGTGAIATLEALDHFDLLTRLLPEWATVRAKPQRNAYHRYTVDRHLMQAAANAASLTRRVSRPDLLLLGALLHDIGKGFPGDHTEAGITVVRRIGPRMGLQPADVDVLVAMVDHHLLLPDAATRRDIDDPSTIDAVARAVGDRTTLELLHALTEADGLATGTSAWSDWKAGLVDRLVERVAAVLEGRPAPEPNVADALPASVVASDGLHVVDGKCVVVAPDRVGLFSAMAGVLAVNGVDVRSATVGALDHHRAVEVFEVVGAFGADPDWGRIARDVDAALAGTIDVERRLDERARSYPRRHRLLAAPPRVIVDNDASARATVLEVRAPDDIGVLYRITKAIASRGLDVRAARVSTLGHEVVDAFYVVDSDGKKVDDAATLDAVEAAVLAALS